IQLTMRLETNRDSLRLRFPSSQEYEVVLRNPDGAVIWTWSDGMAFLPAAHERDVAGSWSATVRIPRPASPGPAPQPGVYTAEVWLTTEPDSPRFAVTLPLTITPGIIMPAE